MPMYRKLLPFLMIVAGCSEGGKPEPPHYDSERARTVLTETLDAWKKGDTKALPRRKPPIRFVDDDLVQGMRLMDYELEQPDAPIALHQDVEVILSLRDARGKAVHREARYQVATEPALAVLRSDR
ncbi:hypothetical protein SAMN05444166_5206 [Singulisphaera sp. GP187]|uniref:hypothetical protein n=1 Tax=Singulisphaera sp. GP187 TaxID=1882752 RepID=UPI00092B328D|nr:hypothetical protein [Singulisphaera sp. GP187]SIO56243.1 hypothetical protein SAMN05444166_5206 [Singulisphaera sp. GP187]